jgi:ribosomal-protein-alanine N-acetyltransferase
MRKDFMLMTERLELLPLTAPQLRLWAEELPTLEREMHLTYQAEPMTGFFREIVREQLTATEQDPENYCWHSFWLLLRKTDRVVVGSADFKDVPSEAGEVEIGYGLGKAFEHQGYMTEAVEAMCTWALAQAGVSHVIAETDVDGYASQRILRRCGFSQYSSGDTLWWRR